MTLPDPVTAALIVKVNSCRPASNHFRCSILQRDCSAAGWAAQQTGEQRPGVSHAEHGGKHRDVSSSTFWKCLILMMWCWTHEYHDRPGTGPGASCDQIHPQSQDPRLVTSHRHQLSAIWLRYRGYHDLANQKAADQRVVSVKMLWQDGILESDGERYTQWGHDRHIRTNTGPPLTREDPG